MRIKPKDKVMVRQHLDKSLSVWYKENRVMVEEIKHVAKKTAATKSSEGGYNTTRRSEYSRCNKWKTPWSQYNPYWLKGDSAHPAIRVGAKKRVRQDKSTMFSAATVDSGG